MTRILCNIGKIMSGICAIVLAAGGSVRMGTKKMLLPYRGMTVIEKVIENVLASGIDRVLVVTGSGKDEIVKVIRRLPVEQCYNENWKEGMLSSVKCGFRSLPEKCSAVMVFLGDQPMIHTATIEEVIYAYRKSGKGIIMPVYKKKRGHPLLIDIKYTDELEKLNPDEGLRMLAHKFPVDVLEVETDDPAVLKDIDTPEDYRNELNQIY
ncbi:MAG: putative MobA-like protein [Bacteroidetes bacterium]|nr:putative MobA-like protein [Bacteroidota bacterium]